MNEIKVETVKYWDFLQVDIYPFWEWLWKYRVSWTIEYVESEVERILNLYHKKRM